MSSSPILVNVQEDRLTTSASSAKKTNPFQNLVSPKTWKIFVSTFITIFLAEIGDKTQLTTLLMTAESHAPWIVFAGAGSALVLTSLLGVLLGQWLATRISPRTLERAAGSSLLLISALLIWEVLHS
ncbi:hypothetical protein PCC9214_05257 [Planktothrix tepida]|uniref:GDT1 family protein n=1 Tax=Planktothrix tepida PCC 9214 TaxID=671072 RepID=A0A1J1LJI2_9CYAN|nr:TMEM165/GDT1 family protein [Planktothrix tepida]CAD5984343.1 hypothetical protein PCC9214_05257 [Planktothrix tepida]CUR32194.1 hypothetical protein PL9214430166 [Planktothrix tepida PCC 9214]